MNVLFRKTVTVSSSDEINGLIQIQEDTIDGVVIFSFLSWLGLITFGNNLFHESWQINLIGIILVVLTVISFLTTEPHPLLSTRLIILSWFMFTVFITLWLPDQPVASLLVIPIILTALFINFLSALVLAVVVLSILFYLSFTHVQVLNLINLTIASTLIAFCLIFLWMFMQSVRRMVSSSLMQYKQGRVELEEARDRQGELGQALKDLAETNQQMARLNQLINAIRFQAEEAERVKTEFVSNVSHELRTPLNMIIGYSEMIMNMPAAYGTRLPQALMADVRAIYRNSQHLIQLINDILDISQVEVQRMSLNKEWVSIIEIANEAISAVQPFLESKALYIKLDLLSDVPMWYGDRTRIRQVLLNLLSNAARFTEKGGITVSIECEENHVKVNVMDTGPGILPEDLPKLFEPFRQLDGTLRRKQGGSGLGLNISRRFVELHGGQMGVESRVEQGSTFWFSLPLMPQTPGNAGFERWISSEYEQRRHQSLAPRQTILPRLVILEEQDILLKGTSRYLDEVVVQSAVSPAAARVLLDESPAEVALVRGNSLDQTLTWSRELAGAKYPTPIIGCMMPSEDSNHTLNINGYLIKPVTSSQLLEAVQSIPKPIKSILIADDDPDALQLFARVLSMKPHSYRVLQASNGLEALSLLRNRQVDLILLDLSMPVMDGMAVLEEKENDPVLKDIPTFILSAKDPNGQPKVASSLIVTRDGGFSLPELLRCSLYISETLSLPRQNPIQNHLETFT